MRVQRTRKNPTKTELNFLLYNLKTELLDTCDRA